MNQRDDFSLRSDQTTRRDQSSSLPVRPAIPRIKGKDDDEDQRVRNEFTLELERTGADKVRAMLARGEIRGSRATIALAWLRGR